MKSVAYILNNKVHNRGILSISPETSVLDALGVMAEHDVGALAVIDDDGRLAGLFTEREYARRVILMGKASKDTPVRAVMNPDVTCVRPEHTLEECMALMTERRTRHLPVLVENQAVGLISIGDVVREIISEQKLLIAQLEHYIYSSGAVGANGA